MPTPLTFSFDHAHAAPAQLGDLLGGKGANLAEMTSVLRLPVPPGFTITTEACRAYLVHGWPAALDAEIDAQLAAFEQRIGRRLGDAHDPLLVSVRSGARESMPGMLDTVLNLGLNPATAAALARRTEPRFAWDAFRRFMHMYAKVVLQYDMGRFEAEVERAVHAAGRSAVSELDGSQHGELCVQLWRLLQGAAVPLPADPRQQLRATIEAVFRSWNGARAQSYRAHEGIAENLGTAVNVQAMVFGNRDANSGTGVAFSRDAATGEAVPYGDFLLCAQGEDVVAGGFQTGGLDSMRAAMPHAHAQLMGTLRLLEQHYRDLCDTEFTVESSRFYMLQTRIGKRTARAALRMAVEMATAGDWRISRQTAVKRFTLTQYDQLHHASLAPGGTWLARGVPASPGAAVGRVCLSADACLEAADRNEPVILVRSETSTEDVHGMQVAAGILTSRGGLASHAAVVARGWNIPAVVGAEQIVVTAEGFNAGAHLVRAGDLIALDGSSGQVLKGEVEVVPASSPPELQTLLGWAADLAGLPRAEAAARPRETLDAAHARLRDAADPS